MGRFNGRPPWLNKSSLRGDAAVEENPTLDDEPTEEAEEIVDLFAALEDSPDDPELESIATRISASTRSAAAPSTLSSSRQPSVIRMWR